jgi:hypothetical protein
MDQGYTDAQKLRKCNKITQAAMSRELDFLFKFQGQKSNHPRWEVIQLSRYVVQMSCPVDKHILNLFVRLFKTILNLSLETYHGTKQFEDSPRRNDRIRRTLVKCAERQTKVKLEYAYTTKCGNAVCDIEIFLYIGGW